MVEEIMQMGKRKFIIWMFGSFQLCLLVGFHLISDIVFRDCYIGLTTATVLGYAAEYFAKK